MFFTQSLCLSVCLSLCVSVSVSVCLCVCHQDCDEMAGLSNTVLGEAITPDSSSKMQHYQDDPLAGLMNGSTPNFTNMLFSSG